MGKYRAEFKLMVVQEYLRGHESIRSVGRKYGIHHAEVHKWITNYRYLGEEGLQRSRQNQTYTFDFKLHVVKLYLSNEISYQQLAVKSGISTPALIAQWVKKYRTAGPEALKPKKKGQDRTMNQNEMIRDIEDCSPDKQQELLKQLQEENLRLRIENAFLKESRRLRLEEEQLLSELRELSAASGENSN